MTTTTDTSSVAGALFTFDTYGFTFDDADSALTTFDTAAPTEWTNLVGETLSPDESLANGLLHPVAEAVALTEAMAQGIGDAQGEAFSVAETNAHVWGSILAFAEALGLGDELANETTQDAFAEAFSAAEAAVKGIGYNTAQSLALSEDASALTVWTRAFSEALAFVDDQGSDYAKVVVETMGFVDLLYRNADAVWQEFQVRGAPLSIDDIADIVGYSAPVGYSPLVDFVAGDYDFQKALFGIILKSSSADTRPALADCTIVADMPDINDAGTATINAAGTLVIAFAKKFTIPPSVAVAMTTAAQASTAVVVGAPTKVGFTCGLQVSPGVYTTGSLSWTAVGR